MGINVDYSTANGLLKEAKAVAERIWQQEFGGEVKIRLDNIERSEVYNKNLTIDPEQSCVYVNLSLNLPSIQCNVVFQIIDDKYVATNLRISDESNPMRTYRKDFKLDKE